jgi:hypothetical protein
MEFHEIDTLLLEADGTSAGNKIGKMFSSFLIGGNLSIVCQEN